MKILCAACQGKVVASKCAEKRAYGIALDLGEYRPSPHIHGPSARSAPRLTPTVMPIKHRVRHAREYSQHRAKSLRAFAAYRKVHASYKWHEEFHLIARRRLYRNSAACRICSRWPDTRRDVASREGSRSQTHREVR